MDFAKPFTFVFEDENWLSKIALVAVISLIPVVGVLVLLGWGLEITRRVIRDELPILPEVDFGKHLGDGFKGFVIGLVYSVPMLLLVILMSVFSAALSNSYNTDFANAVLILLVVCLALFILLYGLVLNLLAPAAYARFAATGSMSAAFQFGEVWRTVTANLGGYVLVVLATILAGFIAGLGSIACVIGVIFTGTYAAAVLYHFYGQAYKQARLNRSL